MNFANHPIWLVSQIWVKITHIFTVPLHDKITQEIQMELENEVETFCNVLVSDSEAMVINSIVDKEMNFGWRIQKKEFNSEFETAKTLFQEMMNNEHTGCFIWIATKVNTYCGHVF